VECVLIVSKCVNFVGPFPWSLEVGLFQEADYMAWPRARVNCKHYNNEWTLQLQLNNFLVSAPKEQHKTKTAELSQRRPRDAPSRSIWVPWKVSRVLTTHPAIFP